MSLSLAATLGLDFAPPSNWASIESVAGSLAVDVASLETVVVGLERYGWTAGGGETWVFLTDADGWTYHATETELRNAAMAPMNGDE